LALVLDVSVLSNTVLCNIITFYRLNQAKWAVEKTER
jgi:hypothetical protein